MRDSRTPSYGDEARAYLVRAREQADKVNACSDRHADQQFDPKRARDLAVMNALVALALATVPPPPGSRLA